MPNDPYSPLKKKWNVIVAVPVPQLLHDSHMQKTWQIVKIKCGSNKGLEVAS
jgi:hypothetical protein